MRFWNEFERVSFRFIFSNICFSANSNPNSLGCSRTRGSSSHTRVGSGSRARVGSGSCTLVVARGCDACVHDHSSLSS